MLRRLLAFLLDRHHHSTTSSHAGYMSHPDPSAFERMRGEQVWLREDSLRGTDDR